MPCTQAATAALSGRPRHEFPDAALPDTNSQVHVFVLSSLARFVLSSVARGYISLLVNCLCFPAAARLEFVAKNKNKADLDGLHAPCGGGRSSCSLSGQSCRVHHASACVLCVCRNKGVYGSRLSAAHHAAACQRGRAVDREC